MCIRDSSKTEHKVGERVLGTDPVSGKPVSVKICLLYTSGLLYYQDDKYPEAIQAYKQVIAGYPGSEEARLAQREDVYKRQEHEWE